MQMLPENEVTINKFRVDKERWPSLRARWSTHVYTHELSIVAIKLIAQVPSIFVHALNYYFINNRRPIVRTSVVTHCNNGTFSFCPALSVLFIVRCYFPSPRHSRTTMFASSYECIYDKENTPSEAHVSKFLRRCQRLFDYTGEILLPSIIRATSHYRTCNSCRLLQK